MNVFNNLIQVNENDELVNNQWIEWDHFSIPNKPEWFRDVIRGYNGLDRALHFMFGDRWVLLAKKECTTVPVT